MFINFSNHSSEMWSAEQINAANVFSDIKDIQFPNVSPELSSADINEMAATIADQIAGMKPDAVLCQGEFSLAYAVINKLRQKDIKVLAACSERRTENIVENGRLIKKVIFEFEGFREYI